MADLRGFSRRFGVLRNRVERNIPRAQRQFAFRADQAVTSATPVDEGRARSNWLVNIGSPRSDTIPPYSPGQDGSTAAANLQQAQAQARAALASHRPRSDIHITNNLPYIGDLNEGSSAQAPANFVEKAVNAAVQASRGIRILTGRGL